MRQEGKRDGSIKKSKSRIRKPVFLLIFDGFGIRKSRKANAIALARTPNLDRIFRTYSTTHILAHNGAVGLPKGYIGNSEDGHMNIGAGRIVLQSLSRINAEIEQGSFFDNDVLVGACKHAKRHGSSLHLLGLLSDGGVHSHIDHFKAMVRLAKAQQVKKVFIHAFLDGRDVPPRSAKKYVAAMESFCRSQGIGRISTVHGRYYAMDRDRRWERTKLSYDCLTQSSGFHAKNAASAVAMGYARSENDEFIRPTVVDCADSAQFIRDGDAVVFLNFREDRARQLTAALSQKGFKGFKRVMVRGMRMACMTEYDHGFGLAVAFPFIPPRNSLGEYISRLGLKQLRIAETEKYAHVTYFFSGGNEHMFRGERRVLIPSDRSVPTYDKRPRMRTQEIAQEAIRFMRKERPDLVVCNFATPDMVGHTGVLKATIKAVETVDVCTQSIESICKELGYVLCITADHGNAEQKSGVFKTSHTTNPVPFCIIEDDAHGRPLKYRLLQKKGVLGDVAPTILKIMGLEKPKEMERNGLIL